ncbi:MAG: DUF805 domain-containing protein [Acetobacter sp.]|nr:DUF805 domain-containing protein [Acetobacter sp.]
MAPKSAAKTQRTSKTALSGVRSDAPARRTGKKAAVSQTAARSAVKKARDAAPKAAAQASAASQTAATPAKPQAPLTASSPAQSAVSSGTSKAPERAGWKKTFTLRGRSSRFELWTFLLVNSVLTVIIQLKCSYILSPRFLRAANDMGYSLPKIENYILAAETLFYLVILLPLFPVGSLLIRRMHDLNRLAWRNYLEPVFMGVVVLSMINLTVASLANTDFAYTIMLLSICFVTILYGVGFYGLKFLIMTLFYRGDAEKNNYGPARYNDDEHEERALNLSCWYFLFMGTVGLLYLALALL